MTIRAADPADAGAIRRVDGLSASTVALLDHDLSAQDRCCLVAAATDRTATPDASDAEVVGYAAAVVQVGEAQVLDLVVSSDQRGRRIGSRLLDALLTEVAARGAGPVTLEVAIDNAAALALYRRRGFVVEGRRPRYYPDGTDALILWRRPTADVVGAEPATTSTSLKDRPRGERATGERAPRREPQREDD